MNRKSGITWLLIVVLGFAIGGCATTRENNDGEPSERRRAERPVNAGYAGVEMSLARTVSEVRSVQLYQTGSEASIPVIRLQSGQTLSLKFDLLTDAGRPLSVFFYHANRRWQRDLTPSEYLAGFQRGDLHDYQASRLTEVPYVHFRYRFPNNEIRFLLSGNYIVRVTEQGREDQVLFERPFFITEEATELDFGIQNIMGGQVGWPLNQPLLRFRTPDPMQSNFFDMHVCFARNARFDLSRCAARPSLVELPFLQFYLPREASFDVEQEYRLLDLRTLRTGHRIASIDRQSRPYSVELEPDYAHLSSNPTGLFLAGQPAIATEVRDVADPDIMGEYVDVEFRYVPPENEELPGPVLVAGSFNNWELDPENRLEWNDEQNRYEGTLLIKQGVYEYRYHTVDYEVNRRQRQVFATQSLYTALLYYFDPVRNTDRLLAMSNVLAR